MRTARTANRRTEDASPHGNSERYKEPPLPEEPAPVEEEKAEPELSLQESASYAYLLNPDDLLWRAGDFNIQAAKMENELGVRVLAVLWRCDDSREYRLPPQELYRKFKIDDSAQGKNLLIFLAVDPQRYFLEIVPGPALKDVLTEPVISRLKRVFMLPFIEQKRYGPCLEHAMTELFRICSLTSKRLLPRKKTAKPSPLPCCFLSALL